MASNFPRPGAVSTQLKPVKSSDLSSQATHLPSAPKKALGQHFLRDRRILGRIADALQLGPADRVIEIGPGTGLLTRELLSRGPHVFAVELDQALAEALPSLLGYPANLTVVNADARLVRPEVVLGDYVPCKLVGNLPYYAAAPIIRNFLEAEHQPSLMVVMVQKEVAQNMAARPGRMSLLAVSVQLYAQVDILWYVRPGAFYPPPRVSSAVVRLEPLEHPLVDKERREGFFRLVRAGFCAPRKQIHNALSQGLEISSEETQRLLMNAGIEPRRRAETLDLQEWAQLHHVWNG